MPKFIKVKDRNGFEIYVNVDMIISFTKKDNGSYISMLDIDDTGIIQQTPEEILKLIAEVED